MSCEPYASASWYDYLDVECVAQVQAWPVCEVVNPLHANHSRLGCTRREISSLALACRSGERADPYQGVLYHMSLEQGGAEQQGSSRETCCFGQPGAVSVTSAASVTVSDIDDDDDLIFDDILRMNEELCSKCFSMRSGCWYVSC